MLSRRQFLKLSAAIGTGLALPWQFQPVPAFAAAGTPNVTKFIDPLISAIPKLTPTANPLYPGADYYEITMSAGAHKFHSQFLGSAATLRYSAMPYLGQTIEAQAGKPVVVKYINNLPPTEAQHPLAASIDPTVPDPMMYASPDGSPLPGGRAVPHLHGGFTAPGFDGHPHAWFTPTGKRGSHYTSLSGQAANEAIFVYSNQQPAAMLWYHDHAMGITRLNAYAGLAALYFIRDAHDTGVAGTGLNLPAGPYEIPLVIQDKQFNANGSLFYPTVGLNAVHPIWVPEFFGDTPVVNAVAYPFLAVEPRRYRFRIVNGSQARFYNLWLDDGKNPIPFWLIGMEQSLTPAPVPLTKLLIAPGERADIIVDFSKVPFGSVLTMLNNAKAPFPGGRGGAVGQIMQFRVNKPLVGADTTTLPQNLALPAVPRLAATPGAPMREIVMLETMDMATGTPVDVRLNGKWFDDGTVDETPKLNTNEIWQFINLTGDAHPMHLHLVKFQVVNRQPFNAKAYTAAWLAWINGGGNPATKPVLANFLAGAATPPLPQELGWKDTAISYPGEILRVISKFEVPPGTQLPAEYVYHCHILEHEENEMMRPFTVNP
ncbi:MAG: multicopper oxidase domain-containing protein [Chloroflexi bacterium]|nr:multicopper oxidase domain-containing protein [Chloroflexota bacterium]